MSVNRNLVEKPHCFRLTQQASVQHNQRMNIKDIIRKAGGPVKVGRVLMRDHSTVAKWDKVPALHARQVAKLAGLHAHDVRPDVYDPPEGVEG